MQAVRKDSTTDQVRHRLILEHVATNIDSAQAAVYSPGGVELRAMLSTGVTVSSEVASLKINPWAYELGTGYKVAWELTVGSDIYERDTFFRVVRRHFYSTLSQQDVFALHPNVQKFLGSSPDLTPQLEWAWHRIEIELERHRGEYPEHLFDPERFKNAHMAWTLAEFYLGNAASRQTDNWDKAEKYEALGDRLLAAAMDKVESDANRDGLLDEAEGEEKQRTLLRFSR